MAIHFWPSKVSWDGSSLVPWSTKDPEDSSNTPVVGRLIYRYSACTSVVKAVRKAHKPFGEGNAAETNAEIFGIECWSFIYVLLVGGAAAGYMRWYSGDYKGMFAADQESQFGSLWKNVTCFQDDLPPLIKVYAKQVYSSNSEITGTEKVVDGNKVFVREMAALASKKQFERWTVLPGYLSMQLFSAYMQRSFRNVNKDATLFAKCRHILHSHCFENLHGRIYTTDVKTLLVLDTLAKGSTIKK